MRIDRTKLSEYGMLAWFFDVVIAQYSKEYPEEFEQLCDRQKIHRGVDLTLTIEGKEIGLESFFMRLEQHFVAELSKSVEDESIELFKQTINDKLETIISPAITPLLQSTIDNIRKKNANNETIG